MTTPHLITVEEKIDDLIGELVSHSTGFSEYADCKIWDTKIDLDAYKEKLRQAFTELLSTQRGEVRELIGQHNARILNEYQLQGLGDERILYDVIAKATTETLDDMIAKLG